MKIVVVGTGPVAREHSKVLTALKQSFVAVGRSAARASSFSEETGIEAFSGGIEAYLNLHPTPDAAVVCVPPGELSSVATAVVKSGVKLLLIEKPGGLDLDELQGLHALSGTRGAKVFVAYNRRFYSSVERCKHWIDVDGGVQTFHFDFTELSARIVALGKPQRVLERWFEANSTHVVDLAFFLGGEPRELTSITTSHLDWHRRGSRFVGHGVSVNEALFSYHANWNAPGRWSVELTTPLRKLFLRPLETLRIQVAGSFEVLAEETGDLDVQFKPGFYRQMQAFLGLSAETNRLMTLEQQVARARNVYARICPEVS